ncbi:hypothetical protein [Faecalibacterium sp. An121]|uniref:hypothetical protein n=1 Tax=Faecalibacterium sp. An121 TaxID=1965550 RepID=UPI00117A59D3|nr:hypothetical protein [Faecalibacterium sp. An121]
MKKAFIILGNGFTIDFLHYYNKFDNTVAEKIDVRNLFRLGDKINSPWDSKPGFLSYKHCPNLWTLGARASSTAEESTALIEEIIACANMFFDFVNDPKQKAKRLKLTTSGVSSLHLRAYCELIVYLQHLFSCYNSVISETKLEGFLNSDSEWGWLKFFKHIQDDKYDKIVFVTYNYDIWLERILKILNVDFCISGFEELNGKKVEIVKPHGSISFVPKDYVGSSYAINYNFDYNGIPIENLELRYDELDKYDKGAIIPPAGDSARLQSSVPWSEKLRQRATNLATEIEENDEIVLCGMSYWYVDRREIDELLIDLNQNANFTFINPQPPRDLNAVLTSIFSKYVQQSSSSEIGGILND